MRKVKRKPKGKLPIAATDSPVGPMKSERDYEAEDGLRTLVRGHHIQSDRKLMKRIKDHARRERQANERVLRLDGKEL